MKLYRYDDRVYSTCSISVDGYESYGSTPVQLELREYDVMKKTPCGYWISYAFSKKWVRSGDGGRFAYPTKEKALHSFRLRKRVQVKIYSNRLRRAEEALRLHDIELLKLAAQSGVELHQG